MLDKEEYMKKGFTLVEVLVAIFIFVLVLIAAYQVYERSQKTYILGEQMADLQQNVRFAYEQISLDLRRAGYNVYPDDESKRPDEQIEGMWSGAIAIRADFDEEPAGDDYICEDTNGDRMCDGGTGNFLNVSTRNEEIRIYALAKKPNDSGETIKFLADLSKPRNAFVGDLDHMEIIEIKGVAINQNNPPYTLYRITIDKDATINDGGTVPSTDLVWTPLASNIYSLQFTYYTEAGIEPSYILTPDPLDLTSLELDNLRVHGFPFGGTPSNHVKYVQFSLKGLTQNPDPMWVDGSDPYPQTKNKRKIELKSTIVLKNVGMAPHELADIVPPDAPTDLDYTDGYCNGVLLTWQPSLALDVTSYWIQVLDDNSYNNFGGEFKYNCDDLPESCYVISTPEPHYNGRVGWFIDLQYGITYHARVFSQDKAGNFSLDAATLGANDPPFEIKNNPIKPKAPNFVLENFKTDVFQNLNRFFVSFEPPKGYESTQPDNCKKPPVEEDAYFDIKIRDLYGYRLYHKRFPTSTASDFTVTDEEAYRVAREKDPSNPGEIYIDVSQTSFPDIKACPCEYYTYKIRSATSCSILSPQNKEADCANLFLSDFSDIPKDSIGEPVAFLIPEHQDYSIDPKIVPGKPQSINASAVQTSPENYSITLKVSPVISAVKRNADGTYEPTDLKIEAWRYKVYKYNTEEDANNDTNGQEILDTNLSGAGDLADWDAGVDGGKEYLKEAEEVSFAIGEFNIPSGEKRYFRVRGYYRCADGANEYLGQLSDPISVPCNVNWTPIITAPPVDNALITSPYTFIFEARNLQGGVTISTVTFSIPTPYNESYTVNGSNPAFWDWNNPTYPDGTYLLTVSATDSNGCSVTVDRYFVINSACGNYKINTLSPPFNDEITYQLQRLITNNYVLLKRIAYSSSGNYLYENINFYESDPTAGSPTPINLWSGTAQNLDGKWIGYDQPIVYNQSNWCGHLKLHPDPSDSTKQNWFRVNFDKNIDSSNGALNLLGDFTYINCDGVQIEPYNIPKKGTMNINLNKIICGYTNSINTRSPNITIDYCTGFVSLYCPAGSGYCTGSITFYYPNTELECKKVPIYLGP